MIVLVQRCQKKLDHLWATGFEPGWLASKMEALPTELSLGFQFCAINKNIIISYQWRIPTKVDWLIFIILALLLVLHCMLEPRCFTAMTLYNHHNDCWQWALLQIEVLSAHHMILPSDCSLLRMIWLLCCTISIYFLRLFYQNEKENVKGTILFV